MLEKLTETFSGITRRLSGNTRLSENNIREAVEEINKWYFTFKSGKMRNYCQVVGFLNCVRGHQCKTSITYRHYI